MLYLNYRIIVLHNINIIKINIEYYKPLLKM